MEWFGGSIEQAIKQVRDNESFLCVFVKGLLSRVVDLVEIRRGSWYFNVERNNFVCNSC